MNLNIISKNIRYHRKKQNLLQKELAEKAGLTKNYISQIECGNKKPSMEAFIKITNALGISADSMLFGLIDTPNIDTSLINDKLLELTTEDQKFICCLVDQLIEKFNTK